MDAVVVSGQGAHFNSRNRVPERHGVVFIGCRQHPAVRREGDAVDGACPGAHEKFLRSACRIPDFDLTHAVQYAGSRGEEFAVGRKGDMLDPVVVPSKMGQGNLVGFLQRDDAEAGAQRG